MSTFLSVLFVLFFSFPVLADERQALRDDNLLLKAELQLAWTNKLYLLFDLQVPEIMLKAGGVTIRRMPVSRVRSFGPPPSPRVRKLAAKKSLFAPRRPAAIIAGSEGTKGQEVDIADTVLELDDMPENYRLLLDDGSNLAIESDRTDWRGWLGLFRSGGWGWYRRALHLLRPGTESEKSELQLTMTGTDARRLYWSFDLGGPCLFRHADDLPR